MMASLKNRVKIEIGAKSYYTNDEATIKLSEDIEKLKTENMNLNFYLIVSRQKVAIIESKWWYKIFKNW